MAQTQLTYDDMEALRVLDTHGANRLAEYDTAKLARAGLITHGSRADGTYELTATGKRMVDQHVARTGDGPEALKGIFANVLGTRR